MAWPLTPFRTMADGSTFWDAALGNALQAGTNGIIGGTYSLAGAVLDNVGGVSQAARSATSALQRAQASDGTARSTTDWLGFRTGPVIETIDSFMGMKAAVSGVQAAVSFGGAAGWVVTSTTNTSTGRVGALGNSGMFPGGACQLLLKSARTSADSIILSSNLFYNAFSATTFSGVDCSIAKAVVTVFEWGFAVGYLGANNTSADWFMGLGTDAATNPLTTAGYMTAALRFAPTQNSDTTIQFVTGDGTTQNAINTTLTPAFNTRYRVRMEIHRSLSPLGLDVIKLYIATGSGASTLFSTSTNLPISGSLPYDLLWKTYFKSTGTPSNNAEIDLAYWKMFAQPYGGLTSGALSSDV